MKFSRVLVVCFPDGGETQVEHAYVLDVNDIQYLLYDFEKDPAVPKRLLGLPRDALVVLEDGRWRTRLYRDRFRACLEGAGIDTSTVKTVLVTFRASYDE